MALRALARAPAKGRGKCCLRGAACRPVRPDRGRFALERCRQGAGHAPGAPRLAHSLLSRGEGMVDSRRGSQHAARDVCPRSERHGADRGLGIGVGGIRASCRAPSWVLGGTARAPTWRLEATTPRSAGALGALLKQQAEHGQQGRGHIGCTIGRCRRRHCLPRSLQASAEHLAAQGSDWPRGIPE